MPHRTRCILFQSLFLFVFLLISPPFAHAYYYAPAYASPHAAALAPWPWSFEMGGGPTTVVGSARDQLTNGSNFTFGGGYNFSPRAGILLEFMDSGLGITDDVIRQNQAIGGDASVFSVTLNPIWRFRIAGPIGGYLIGGGGFYERQIRVDEFVTEFVPTFNGGFFDTEIRRFRQNDDTGGVNAGMGFTWNIGWGTKFFAEARYHYIFTSGTATQLIPVTIGLRW